MASLVHLLVRRFLSMLTWPPEGGQNTWPRWPIHLAQVASTLSPWKHLTMENIHRTDIYDFMHLLLKRGYGAYVPTFNSKTRVRITFVCPILTPKLTLQSCLEVRHLYFPSSGGQNQTKRRMWHSQNRKEKLTMENKVIYR